MTSMYISEPTFSTCSGQFSSCTKGVFGIGLVGAILIAEQQERMEEPSSSVVRKGTETIPVENQLQER